MKRHWLRVTSLLSVVVALVFSSFADTWKSKFAESPPWSSFAVVALLLGALSFYVLAFVLDSYRRLPPRRFPSGVCRKCGCNFTASASSICPECRQGRPVRRLVLTLSSILVFSGLICAIFNFLGSNVLNHDSGRHWFNVPGFPLPFMWRFRYGMLYLATGEHSGWHYHQLRIPLPLSPGVLVLAGWTVLLALIPAHIRSLRRAERRSRGLCPNCSYNLFGNISGI